MTTRIPISIIVPTYNSERYLRSSIESLYLFPKGIPAQILIIDDCSSDSTLKVAASLASEYKEIEILKTPHNSGAAVARHLGLSNARYELAGFLDSDDTVSSGAFFHAYNTLVETGADFCSMQLFRVDQNGLELGQIPLAIPEREIISGRQAAIFSLIDWSMNATGICRTKLWLEAYNDVPLELFDSDELVTRNLLLSSKKVTVCRGKYLYLVNSKSSTQTRKINEFDNLVKTFWILKFCNTNDLCLGEPKLSNSVIQMAVNSSWIFLTNAKKSAVSSNGRKIVNSMLQEIKSLIKENRGEIQFKKDVLIAIYLMKASCKSKFLTELLCSFVQFKNKIKST